MLLPLTLIRSICTSITSLCEKCLNVFHTAEAKEFHDSICMVKENKPRVVKYPAYDKPICWEEKDNYMLNQIPTWMVANFKCVLMKEEQMKGLNIKIIHKHQPCAWGLTVVTERKGASYDQTFVKVAKNMVKPWSHLCIRLLRLHSRCIVMSECWCQWKSSRDEED